MLGHPRRGVVFGLEAEGLVGGSGTARGVKLHASSRCHHRRFCSREDVLRPVCSQGSECALPPVIASGAPKVRSAAISPALKIFLSYSPLPERGMESLPHAQTSSPRGDVWFRGGKASGRLRNCAWGKDSMPLSATTAGFFRYVVFLSFAKILLKVFLGFFEYLLSLLETSLNIIYFLSSIVSKSFLLNLS